MAAEFEQTDDKITITQRRRDLRWITGVAVALWLLGCLVGLVRPDLVGLRRELLVPVSLISWLAYAAIFSRTSVEITAVLDRKAGRIDVQGHGWLYRSWKVARPLSEVRDIVMERVYQGRRSYGWEIYVVFAGGTRALLWSPSTNHEVPERVAALRSLLERSEKAPHPWG